MQIFQVNQKSAPSFHPFRESYRIKFAKSWQSGGTEPQSPTDGSVKIISYHKYGSLYERLVPMVAALTLILLLSLTSASTRRAHKRLIIHVPFRIKTHHHTHTVYSHIRSASSSGGGGGDNGKGSGAGTKQTIYKILSLTMQGKDFSGHSGHGGGHVAHKSSHAGGDGGYEKEFVGSHGGAYDHSHGDTSYDDNYHGGGAMAGRCGDGPHGYGDMVFNHFSRSSDESNESDEYPEVEEYVDEDERGFVWD